MFELCLNFNEYQPMTSYKHAYFISLRIFGEMLQKAPRVIFYYYEYCTVFVLILESLCILFGTSSEGNEWKTADTKIINFEKCQNSWNQEYVEILSKICFFFSLLFVSAMNYSKTGRWQFCLKQ